MAKADPIPIPDVTTVSFMGTCPSRRAYAPWCTMGRCKRVWVINPALYTLARLSVPTGFLGRNVDHVGNEPTKPA